MSSVNIPSGARIQSFVRKTIKQKINSSTWDQISNRYEISQTVAKGDGKVPSTVIHKLTSELSLGQYSVTMAAIRKSGQAVVGGANAAAGKESKPLLKMFSVFFTNQRFPKALPDMTVMGKMDDFYNIAEATIGMIGDDFAEQTDYDCQKAMIDGADSLLTDANAWENSEYGSSINHPVDPVFHPNCYMWISGAVVKNTWSSTYATAITNLATAIDTELDSGDGMTLIAMDAINLKATRTIIPLGGIGGNNEVQYVLKISDAQWYDLTTDTGTGNFRDLLKYTEKGFDRAFTGYMGVYKGMMIIVDQRAPIFNVSATTAGAWQYQTPLADNRVRVLKGSNTGTAECAMLMGPGALAMADVMEMETVKDDRDYRFIKSICGHRIRGTQRVDLDASVAPTSARVNESSFLFLTATLTGSV